MKKLLSLVVILVLLLPALAFAEAEAEFSSYTNETNGYQISYPSDWTLLSKESIDTVIKSVADGSIEGLDASTVESYLAQVQQADMMMCLAPGGAVNFNVMYQEMPAALTNELIVAALCPSFIAQFEAIFPDLTVIEPGATMKCGDVEYAYTAASYTLSDIPMSVVQMYHAKDSMLYVITYTVAPGMVTDADALDTITDTIAASFVPGA